MFDVQCVKCKRTYVPDKGDTEHHGCGGTYVTAVLPCGCGYYGTLQGVRCLNCKVWQ